MEICSLCGKLKSGAETCTDYRVRIQGIFFSPVRYTTRKLTPFNSEEAKMRCPSCNVKPGGYHHIGCGVEICPCCGERWIFCRCHGIKEKLTDTLKLKDNVLDLRTETQKRKSIQKEIL